VTPARNEEALRQLVKLLSQGRFVTAAQIVEETGCARPVAYWRIESLRKRGIVFQTTKVRQGASGPTARAYAIVPNAASRAMNGA
jgi:biotin operon repressor